MSPAPKDKKTTLSSDNNDPKIDYSETLKGSFNNLGDILGPNGLKQMTKDTAGIMKQQKNLMKVMGKLPAIMDMVNGMMKTLNTGSLGKMMGGDQED